MKAHVWSPELATFGYGIGAFTRAFGGALLQNGCDLRFFAKADSPGSWNGCRVWGPARLPAAGRTPAFAAATFAACVSDRPDRVISTHVNFGPVAHAASRMLGTPFTLIAHGMDVHDGMWPSRKAALRAAHQVVAVSGWTRERVLALGGIEPSRVVVLPNTVEETRFTPGDRPQHLVTRYGLQPDERVILTLSRLSVEDTYKGHDRVLRGLPAIRAACGPVRYLLAGEGNDRLRLESVAREIGVADAVTFPGFIADGELVDHYRLADVFVMPSTREGFGIVFLEALCCGTPVLAGNRDGSVDPLDRGRLGRLVDPLDVDEIGRGITELLQRQGPALWFDRQALHDETARLFGRDAFQAHVRRTFAL